MIHILGIVTIFLSLLLGVSILLSPRYRKKSRISLAAIFFLYPLFVLGVIVCTSFDLAMYLPLSFLVPQVIWLIGPLFYFHVRGLTKEKPMLAWYDGVHFLPFIATTVYHAFRIYQWWHWSLMGDVFFYLARRLSRPLLLISVLSLLIYIGLSIYRLFLYDRSARTFLKNILLHGSHLIIVLIYFFFFYECQYLSVYEFAPYAFNAFFIATCISIVTYLVLFIKIPGLFLGDRKYVGSTLSHDRRKEYKARLLDCLFKEKPYLDAGLTLDHLAAMTRIPRSYLSQIINEDFKKSYPDFINYFRIEESKKMLSHPGNGSTIIDILFSVGFNSKSAFNFAFKKAVGVTPRQFRKKAGKGIAGRIPAKEASPT
jgi:AraC-like DNA-binding protein